MDYTNAANVKKSEIISPKISIIMPAYNCEKHIAKAIESILSQEFSDFELLITDDASTDGTWGVINSYSDQRIYTNKNKYNLGYLKTCNSLFNQCRGDFIAFQDADDWSHSKRLLKQLRFLTEYPEVSLVGVFCVLVYGKSIQIVKKYPVNSEEIRLLLNKGLTSLFCGATIMFRKKVLTKIGTYREFFDRIGSEDIDWYIRAIENFQTGNIPEPLYYYRQHPSSISKTKTLNPFKPLSTDFAYAFFIQRRLYSRDHSSQSKDYIKLPANLLSHGSLTDIFTQKVFTPLIKYLEINQKKHRELIFFIAINIILTISAYKIFENHRSYKRRKKSLGIVKLLEENN